MPSSLAAPPPTPQGDHVPPLGLDLDRYHPDVRRIFFARFSRRLEAAGIDPEDVLGEVYASILVRNRGRSPYDPTRASVGKYIFLVCSSVVRNRYHSERRTRMARATQMGRVDDVARIADFYGEAPATPALADGPPWDQAEAEAALRRRLLDASELEPDPGVQLAVRLIALGRSEDEVKGKLRTVGRGGRDQVRAWMREAEEVVRMVLA